MQNVLADRAAVRPRRPGRLLRLASDERLVALVRDGDERAFEALYDRHHSAILGFCRHMLGTREEAEDAVQHTFLSAYRDLTRREQPVALRPWLFAIARNRCLSLLRARRTHVAIDVAEPATDGLTATVERREDLRELLGDLARLPEQQRAALLLAELSTLDHADIATVLGCPREKVKALVFQARTSLAASRAARATPCEQIRLELATASGAALRRGPLRQHLRTCAGCRAFKAEVVTQRRLLALVLPVVPSVALKAGVLSGSAGGAAASGAGAAGVAAATGATSSASSGAFGGLLGSVATTGASKAAVTLAVVGAVAGGGALTERLDHHGGAAPASSTPPPVASAPAHDGAAAPLPASPARRESDERRYARAQPLGHTTRPSPHALAEPPAHAPSYGDTPPEHATPPALGTTPPAHDDAPPGEATPLPGQAAPPPDQSGTPPGQATPPPVQGAPPPDQSGTPPGHGGTPPGHGGVPPGQAKKSSGQDGTPPGQAQEPPGHGDPSGDAPPAADETAPGNSGSAPGHSGKAHGHGN